MCLVYSVFHCNNVTRTVFLYQKHHGSGSQKGCRLQGSGLNLTRLQGSQLNFIKDSRLQFCYYYFIQNQILVDHRINKKQLILFLNGVYSLSLLYWQFTEITVIPNYLFISRYVLKIVSTVTQQKNKLDTVQWKKPRR